MEQNYIAKTQAQTKTPPEGGVFYILGGPGRNRTTDTRIFKTRLGYFRQHPT
jgi:hypothetical protein